MSYILTLNGQNFVLPEQGETGWANIVNDFFGEIAIGTLQKTGGMFVLTNDVNFGEDFGVRSLYFGSVYATDTDSGTLRLSNSETISWRNGAGDGNLDLYILGDELYFNGSPVASMGIADQLFSSTVPIATSGIIRLGNSDTIEWRNNTDDGNLSLYIDSNDLYFNGVKLNDVGGGVGSITYLQTSGSTPSASGMTSISDFTLPMGGVNEPTVVKFDAFVRYQSDGIGLILGYQAPAGSWVNAQIYIQKTESLSTSASFPLGGTSNSSGSLDGATSNTSGVYVATISGTCILGETSGNFEIQFAASDDGSGISIQPFSSCIYTVLQV